MHKTAWIRAVDMIIFKIIVIVDSKLNNVF